jgi:uncharacterized protein (DUF427 family)
MDEGTPKIPGADDQVAIEATGGRIVVRTSGRIVADTTAALTLREAGYPGLSTEDAS